ncbi:MAG: LytTR family DNA-binding domain-containing protein [Pseudomonadota bacterium]|nr:LytTR family DNA-binding domain-containing protein [Pseudomonadota bacterium]
MAGPIRAIIVDDEPLARRGLELRLVAYPDIQVVALCSNGREALEAIAAHSPDLMFLDIEMPGVDGFEVLRRTPQTSMPMVVFVTAFDRYAIDAFDAHALDYLLKPLVDERFERTMAHVREQFAQRRSVRHREQLVALLASVTGAGELDAEELIARGAEGIRRYPEILPIRLGRETVRLPVTAIEWVDAAGDYMCVHAEGRTHVVRATMKEFEERLDPAQFQRIHRSTIVNIRRIRKLKPHTNGEYFLTLDGGHELKLSRSYRDRLERILGRTATASAPSR